MPDDQPGEVTGNSFIATGHAVMTHKESTLFAPVIDDPEDSVLLADDGPPPSSGGAARAGDPLEEALAQQAAGPSWRRGLDRLEVRLGAALLLAALAAGGLPLVAFRGGAKRADRGGAGGDSEELPQAPPARPIRSPESVDDFGCTALHVAADRGLASEVQKLLEEGADPNAVEAWLETPLHFAARVGSADACKLLVERGAEVNPMNESGLTPLLVAAKAGKEPACKLLLDAGGHAGGAADSELPPLLSALLVEQLVTGSGAVRATATSDAQTSGDEE